MTVYFCLDDLLSRLGKDDNGDVVIANIFVPVQTTLLSCGGYREDALALSSQPQLLDMNSPQGAYQLALLAEEVPLYQINLELLIDRILYDRHDNKLVEQAVSKAFEGQSIPHTMPPHTAGNPHSPDSDPAISKDMHAQTGALRHPMIGHLDKITLAKIYLNFIRALPKGYEAYAFEEHILGHYPGPFHKRFSGYVFGEHGKIKADILLGFSTRHDYDSRRPLENYVENGRQNAIKMQITDPHELLWAWLEADHYQMRRCHDIDRLLVLRGLPRLPSWVRIDVFSCLEKEAMKQILAEKLLSADPALSLLPRQPQIRKAIELNAKNQIDDSLQHLLNQTLGQGVQYAGAAERFFERAQRRARESQSL